MPSKKNNNNFSIPLEMLKKCPTADAWEKIGYNRRFGTLVPLASLRSKRNQGIGDFLDLYLFKELSRKIGSSIIQILPINDMGRSKAPYSSISAFALDPAYIAIDDIPEMKDSPSESVNNYLSKNWHIVEKLKSEDYLNINEIRVFKFGVLYKLFWDFINRNRPYNSQRWRNFQSYINSNKYWLEDYAVFRTMKNLFKWSSWKEWPKEYSERDPKAIKKFKEENYHEVLFVKYIQWTAYEQMVGAHNACRKSNVLIKGDIPLQVDFESADVWAHQEYFNLNVCAGAPPDQYSTQGQNWGSPTYKWDNLAKDNYIFWRKRLEYASHFYDIYRIDHIVGIFRIWTVPITEEFPRGTPAGWNAYYEPEDPGEGENKPVWENHGKNILKMMIESTEMLPIGEDLGTIPEVCRTVMNKMGIPGYKVIIWERDWKKEKAPFYKPEEYGYLSMATTTTHDFWTLVGHWYYRDSDPYIANNQENDIKALWKFIMGRKKYTGEYTEDFHNKMLERLFHSSSVFLIMPFADVWGKIPEVYGDDINYDRINEPGNGEREANWASKIPLNLEHFHDDARVKYWADALKKLSKESGRIPE